MNIKQFVGAVLTAQGLSLLSKEEAKGGDRAIMDRAHQFVTLLVTEDFRRIAADYHKDGPLSWSAIRAVAWGVRESMKEVGEPYLAERAGEFVDLTDEGFRARAQRALAAFLNDPGSEWVRVVGGQAPGAGLGDVRLYDFRGKGTSIRGGDVSEIPDGVYEVIR